LKTALVTMQSFEWSYHSYLSNQLSNSVCI